MGFIIGLLKRLLKVSLYSLVFAAIVTIIPNLPPYTNFTTIEIESSKLPVGALKADGSLNKPEQLFKGKLLGPEALKLFNDEVYTSVATGEIIKVSPGGHITFVTKIGQPCSGLLEEHICGRILGFDIDPTKSLIYVADVYHGIWKVNLKTDKKVLLVSPNVEIDGKTPKLFNGLALSKNGDLYWTDSSSDYYFKDGAMSFFADPAGRFLHYNAAKNESKVLLDNLWFPNGVALSPNEEFVVVVETLRFKLLKYYLSGPKKGKTEDFITGLPGTPDNLQVLPDGSGILVALYTASDETQPQLIKSLAKAPLVRKFVARVLTLTQLAFQNLNKVIPNIVFEEIVYKIGHLSSLSGLVPPKSGLLYVDWNGKIIKSYYNTDASLDHTSDAVVYRGKLFLGAPHNRDYIAAVPAPPELIKAFAPLQGKSASKPADVKNGTPVKEERIVKEQKPIVKEQKPTVKEPKPVVKEQKPIVKEQKPIVKEQKPIVNEQKPIVKEQKPIVKEQKPIVKEQKEQKPVAAKPLVKEQKPIVKEQKAADKENIQTPKPTPKPTQKTDKKPAANKNSRDKIPIEEEIPSDTSKPNKETLKVIKKDGPAEIRNPHV